MIIAVYKPEANAINILNTDNLNIRHMNFRPARHPWGSHVYQYASLCPATSLFTANLCPATSLSFASLVDISMKLIASVSHQIHLKKFLYCQSAIQKKLLYCLSAIQKRFQLCQIHPLSKIWKAYQSLKHRKLDRNLDLMSCKVSSKRKICLKQNKPVIWNKWNHLKNP